MIFRKRKKVLDPNDMAYFNIERQVKYSFYFPRTGEFYSTLKPTEEEIAAMDRIRESRAESVRSSQIQGSEEK